MVDDERFMRECLRLADVAGANGDVPVGAIVVLDGVIVGAGRNRREADADPTGHAEILALREACRRAGRWRVDGATMYVTLEPCPMCAGAILQARIPKVVFGALDPKAGSVTSLYQMLEDRRLNHTASVTGGVLAEECGRLLSDFFRSQRRLGKK